MRPGALWIKSWSLWSFLYNKKIAMGDHSDFCLSGKYSQKGYYFSVGRDIMNKIMPKRS